MVSRSVKMTAYALTAVMAFSSMSVTAQAAKGDSVLPSGGVGLSLANNATSLETIAGPADRSAGNVTTGTATAVERAAAPEEQTAVPVEQPAFSAEEELFRNLVIAQVTNYVNVRSLPSEDGEIVGKLYDDSVGNLLGEENGWYLIQSGTVTGYVKGEFCVTGDEAVALAKQVGTCLATVTTTTLKVRMEPSLDAPVLGLVPLGDQLLVLDETEGWVQVDVEEGKGWVSTDYVTLHTEFVEAESKAEEEVRLAKEAEERRKARAAAAKSVQTQEYAPAKENTAVAVASGEGSEMGVAVAEYALQFVGNPYVYGGTSLTDGADCSGFVMSVYANFGVSLPHSSASDRSQGSAVEGGLANAQPGDLICYSGHVALYIGDGQIVHASTKKTGIIVSSADYKKVLAVRRIF
ncbi:MAG: SH3 domain-containing protein [Clostridium sp.]|nr:SH3 domain-containing protein [Acetatifactor muris]MCM1526986.1 SH3 domain-containing protein [Bacteroides sp.]MCM1563149.1 SH3 domain-containing protein [Clostridium sp.]